MDSYSRFRLLILGGAVVVPILLCFVHYLVIGPRGTELKSLPRTIRRLSVWDRLVHLLRILAFLAVVVTGYTMAFGPDSPEEGHVIWGRVFLGGAALALLLWNRYSLPGRGDGQWLRHLGGYFSRKPSEPRSGRFNLGQKAFIWLTLAFAIALAVTGERLTRAEAGTAAFDTWIAVHGILAAITILVVMVHIYLSVFAIPGTWPVLIRGRVAREWLERHHPDDPSLKRDEPNTDTGQESTKKHRTSNPRNTHPI